MTTRDWTKPQRQPLAGLTIVFLNTLWQFLKRFWIVILMALFNGVDGKVSRLEWLTLGLLFITIIAAVIRFVFFRFFIEDDKLVIRQGGIVRETKIIPLERIQSAGIEQGPLHRALGVVKLSIDTAGSQKAEGNIDAIYRSMAEELREKLLSQKTEVLNDPGETVSEVAPAPALPLIQLNGRDLLRLSISANHLEAFFILLSFGIGLYENLNTVDDQWTDQIVGFLPEGSLFVIAFLTIVVLTVTILVSTLRIVFKYYRFRVIATGNGYRITSGLTSVKERLIAFKKIQFVSWSANWIRVRMGLWMLEYHMAGGRELKAALRVQIPVTRESFIPQLASHYLPVFEPGDREGLRMDASFVARRLLLGGFLPAVILFPVLWWAWEWVALLVLVIPIVVGISAACLRKKFRAWIDGETLYIRKGILGWQHVLLRLSKVQTVALRRSRFQRRRGLASLYLYTAGGVVRLHYIDVESARLLADYCLYVVEKVNGE